MKLVTFNRAMSPYVAGERRLVPDDIAVRLQAAGDVSAVEDWPAPTTPQPAPAKPQARAPRSSRLLGQTYLTK